MTRADVKKMIGQRVMVYAPACSEAPQSELHGLAVTFMQLSPTQRDVVRTSAGPLQWTRPAIELTSLDARSVSG